MCYDLVALFASPPLTLVKASVQNVHLVFYSIHGNPNNPSVLQPLILKTTVYFKTLILSQSATTCTQ